MSEFRTERTDEISPEALIGLIGKTVYVGVYEKPTEYDDSEDHVGTLCGTLEAFLQLEGKSEFTVVSSGEKPGNIHYADHVYYSLITWKVSE